MKGLGKLLVFLIFMFLFFILPQILAYLEKKKREQEEIEEEFEQAEPEPSPTEEVVYQVPKEIARRELQERRRRAQKAKPSKMVVPQAKPVSEAQPRAKGPTVVREERRIPVLGKLSISDMRKGIVLAEILKRPRFDRLPFER